MPYRSPNLKSPTLIEPKTSGEAGFFNQLDATPALIGPVRMPVALDDAHDNDRFILHLRDPRDVLVSMFFSWSYSHPGVNEEWRVQLRERGPDHFALKESQTLLEKYQLYIDDYLSRPSAVLLRYEDFVLDRPQWLDALLVALDIDGGMKRYKRLSNDNPAQKVKSEDKNRHIRKAVPGDYKDKLSPETIATLNDQWRDVLKRLAY